jgi:hypothetical protein
MRILVATRATQGRYENDYANALDGELVRLPFVECSRADACGCGRGFVGLGSNLATTTAEVVELPDLTYETYAGLLWDDLAAQCDAAGITHADDRGVLLGLHDDDVRLLTLLASEFPLGAVVRRRGLELFSEPVAA